MTEAQTKPAATNTPGSNSSHPAHPDITQRKDSWWGEPALIATIFTSFIIYATFRVFENNYFESGNFLSPFYSPKIIFDWWKFSPAILILWIPAGFRTTCYYYRKAYYRSFFLTPPACAVDPYGKDGYKGESAFPLVLQNLHRYFFYLAAAILVFLWYDAVISLFKNDGSGGIQVSVLSIVMFANCIFLSGYTFGCHAGRHLCGGSLNCFSSCEMAKGRFKLWEFVTKLNEHHMGWAWFSLFSVALTDFYVRQVCTGAANPIILFQF